MSELGEGASVEEPVVEKEEKGDLKVNVRDVCDASNRIEGAEVIVNGRKKVSDDNGVAELTRLPVGAMSVKVKVHLQDVDYSTFIVHYPKVLSSHSVKSSGSDLVEIKSNSKNSVRIELKIFNIVGKIVFYRRQLDINGDDKYGHWWTVVDENTSFGWWPKYPIGSSENRMTEPPSPPEGLTSYAGRAQKIQHMFNAAIYSVKAKMYEMKESGPVQTVRGVEGDLNGKYWGGIVNKEKNIYADPHALKKDSGDEQYQPVKNDCFVLSEVKESIVDFALSYNGGWSWYLEGGNHCHTFQKKIMRQYKLDKVKVLK